MRNGKTFDGYPFVHDFGLRCYVYGADLKFSEFVKFSWTQCAMIHSGFTCTIEEEKWPSLSGSCELLLPTYVCPSSCRICVS